MNKHKTRFRSLAVLAGIIALALMATAFFHLCLHSIDDNESADSNHHCLLCTVFNHTIISLSFSNLLQSPTITSRPLLLMPVSIELASVQSSITVRAPPQLVLN
jgi:hypothetical protein